MDVLHRFPLGFSVFFGTELTAAVVTACTMTVLLPVLQTQLSTSLQVYSAVQTVAGFLSSASVQSTSEPPEDLQEPQQICRSSSVDGKDSQQCTASQLDEVPVLVSGAGHDSLAMAELTQASFFVCYYVLRL